MNRYPLWRYLLIVVLLVLGVLYSVANLYPEDPAIQITMKEDKPLAATLLADVSKALDAQAIAHKAIAIEQDTLVARFKDNEEQLKAQDVLQATLGNGYNVALNLAPTTPRWLSAIG